MSDEEKDSPVVRLTVAGHTLEVSKGGIWIGVILINAITTVAVVWLLAP